MNSNLVIYQNIQLVLLRFPCSLNERRLSDLGNATGSVIGAVIESTPTGRNDPVKVLQAIANRKDGAQTVAGAALREFAKNASLNSGSIGDTPICTNARAHTHIHTHTHTHTTQV